ncbi:MAG: hypothetical protein M1814_005260 [Vezdaea aestivalis]|nr:MAG: hypothetical protein M1814_005260 [Vezdaea aestivalis]
MQLNYPPPLGAQNNPHRTDAPDPYLQYPYGCCGRTDMSPCHGQLKLLGTPQGASVASWAAGSSQGWNISGIGNHYGGSCQVGFSLDKGKTFTVATSYEGNCPLRTGGNTAAGQNFKFNVPKDIPNGDAVFAWTWNNREQEFNMNCAVVTITGGSGSEAGASPSAAASPVPSSVASSVPSSKPTGSSKGDSYDYDDEGYHCICTKPAPKLKRSIRSVHGGRVHPIKKRDDALAFKDRPKMLMADTKNGCSSPAGHGTELKYLNPGPDVVKGDGEYKLNLPTGSC